MRGKIGKKEGCENFVNQKGCEYMGLTPYYEDGNVVLYNNDMNDAVRELESGSVDLVLTDPPYGIEYVSNHRKSKLKQIANDDVLYMDIDMFWRVLKDSGSLWSFYSHKMELSDNDDRELEMLKDNHSHMYVALNNMLGKLKGSGVSRGEMVAEINQVLCVVDKALATNSRNKPYVSRIKNRIIWVKNNWTAGDLTGDFSNQYECIAFMPKNGFKLNGYRHSNVWEFDRVPPSNHPTEKPIALLSRIIENCTNVGDLVFDPFVGSGATLFACKKLNRRFVGSEIDKEHCENIMNDGRLKQMGLGI